MGRVDVVETEVFKFDELSEEAQETAIEKFRENNLDYEWWEYIYADAKTIASLMGIDIDKIYFSGFSSQGDGACFEGSYEYKKGAPKAVREYAPLDDELVRIANELQAIQKKRFYGLYASVRQSGHYMHENCTSIDVYERRTLRDGYETDEYAGEEVDNDICDALKDLMWWIYKRLENEHDYLNSDEALKETIKDNEYEFTVDGERY